MHWHVMRTAPGGECEFDLLLPDVNYATIHDQMGTPCKF